MRDGNLHALKRDPIDPMTPWAIKWVEGNWIWRYAAKKKVHTFTTTSYNSSHRKICRIGKVSDKFSDQRKQLSSPPFRTTMDKTPQIFHDFVRNSWRFSSTVNLEWSRPSSKKRQTEAWKLFYWGPFSVSELLFSISGCNRSSINLNKRLILFSTDLTIGILVCTTMLNEHDKEKTPIISLLTKQTRDSKIIYTLL